MHSKDIDPNNGMIYFENGTQPTVSAIYLYSLSAHNLPVYLIFVRERSYRLLLLKVWHAG